MILVAGGSGFIGSAVVRRLAREGSEVAVMSAHPSRSRARIESMGASVIQGDVRDAASLQRAVAGAETIVQVLTFPTFPVEKPRKGFTFEEFDHRGTERLVRAAGPEGPSGTFEIGGPDVLSMNEVLGTMMEVRGKRKPLVHFPVALPKLAGFFLQFLPNAPLSPDAVEFVTGDALADTGPLLAAFELSLTPLREGLATYLGCL